MDYWFQSAGREGSGIGEQAAGACWSQFAFAAHNSGLHVETLRHARLSHVSPEFNLQTHISIHSGFYDLYDLRRNAAESELVRLVDKVALKQHLQNQGIPVATALYTSYTSPYVLPVLQKLSRYVVKAAHRHHGGQGVVVVDNGVDLRTGKPISVDEVQESVLAFWPQVPSAAEPRCVPWGDGGHQCVTNAPLVDSALQPAVLVEELATTWDGREGVVADEAFCFVAWGKLVMCGAMCAGGVWCSYFARDGTPIFGRPMHAERGSKDIQGAALRHPIPWGIELHWQIVTLAERAAGILSADFVRVDVFPNGGHPLVAEISIVSGWLGRANLAWGEVDVWLLELLRDRWIEGYAFSDEALAAA